MTTPARVLIIGFSAAVIAAYIAGCTAFPIACPAIGYMNTATLDVRGSVPAALRVCVDESCAASNDVRAPDPDFTVTTPEDLATSPAARNTVRPLGFTVSKQGNNTFGLSGFGTPRSIDAHALDDSGAEIAMTTVTLEWKRVGGSAQCGGRNAAHAVLDFG